MSGSHEETLFENDEFFEMAALIFRDIYDEERRHTVANGEVKLIFNNGMYQGIEEDQGCTD